MNEWMNESEMYLAVAAQKEQSKAALSVTVGYRENWRAERFYQRC